ncbi:hypothetical protein IQ277_12545 [Nostocales cyanobacterium LEGE 12452]|nr:hypothetical protein [Nostocales cyanobacterium LEGE 12452]
MNNGFALILVPFSACTKKSITAATGCSRSLDNSIGTRGIGVTVALLMAAHEAEERIYTGAGFSTAKFCIFRSQYSVNN